MNAPTDRAANTARLIIACPDATGIVAAVSGFLAQRGANLIDAEQHTDREHGEFTMRVVFEPGDEAPDSETFLGAWGELVERHALQSRMSDTGARKRIALLAGPSSHCLTDLLWRCSTGDIDAQIVGVISNHDTHRAIVEHHGVAYHHLPVESRDRAAHETLVMRALDQLGPDLVVLARYMRVLSAGAVERWDKQMINIHHSFLPAFVGSDPYRQAYERGVKLIGATSHFVTKDLDEGPIIAQAVQDVTHHDSVDVLRRKGRDLERVVLAHAVRKWVEDKILVRGNKTIIFR